jgi:hypothetical protein
MKDLKPAQTKPEQAQADVLTEDVLTEVDMAQDALAEAMLFGQVQKQPAQGPARIILGLDCTSSMDEFVAERRITAQAAASLAQALFAGHSGLQVQLAYFRGDGGSANPREFRVSNKWYTDPTELARAITAIEHRAGWTQHCRLLRHAVAEAEKHSIQSLVIVSDAFERRKPLRPHGDDLEAARIHARRLRGLGVQIAVGFKGVIRGGCPLDRAGIDAERAFRKSSRRTATASCSRQRDWRNASARSPPRRRLWPRAMLEVLRRCFSICALSHSTWLSASRSRTRSAHLQKK